MWFRPPPASTMALDDFTDCRKCKHLSKIVRQKQIFVWISIILKVKCIQLNCQMEPSKSSSQTIYFHFIHIHCIHVVFVCVTYFVSYTYQNKPQQQQHQRQPQSLIITKVGKEEEEDYERKKEWMKRNAWHVDFIQTTINCIRVYGDGEAQLCKFSVHPLFS